MSTLRHLKHDLPASVVVFFVALPLCLGIALASGAPLFSGLIAGVIGGIVVGALSRSPLGVSGPAAGLAVIVLTSIEALGSFEAFLLAVVIGGVMQITLGILRAGVLGYFFPAAVIQGMLCGIGLIILLKQLPHAVGYDADPTGDMAYQQLDGGTTFSALSAMLSYIDLAVVFVAAVSFAILLLWELVLVKRHRIFQILPGPLVAVAFGIGYQFVATRWFGGVALSPEHLVFVPVAESFDDLAQLLVMPDFSQLSNPAIYTIAATIAVVASLETLLCVEATDKMDPRKRTTPTNRELVAQGVGNTLSGLVGGLPITQVIVRSSANIQSGARTRASAICHGVLLLVCVAALPHVLNLIPLGVLAAVLILTGYKLARPALFRAMWSHGFEQFLPFVVTVAGVVLTDLLTGVALGIAVAVTMILQHNYRNSHFLHIETRDPDVNRHLVTMHLAEEVTFLNKGAIRQELASLPDGTRLVIDQSKCVYINHDVREIIDDFIKTAPTRNIAVSLVEQGAAARGAVPADLRAAA
ncbi:MAG: SulP family inorganic anion transporter [Gammaproteobacteria bacterium]|nr:SulP family inorganic anion transporter [Gammaproteobacteria bacterium]